MLNWSCWQKYWRLIYICAGVYILCCGAGSIPIGCWYRDTSWQSLVRSVLLLFRPFCTCSCTRCANQKCSSQGACCSAFTLRTVPQHHPHATERIATLRFAQRRKIALKIFLVGCWSSRLFQSPDHNSGEFYLIIHSDQTTKLSKASAVTFLFCLPSFPWSLHLARHNFFSLTFIKEKILCKIICHAVTKVRKYVCRSNLLHFNSPDINSKHLRPSAQKFFSFVSLYSCIRIEKKSLSQIMGKPRL
jgi:hypothetical protein